MMKHNKDQSMLQIWRIYYLEVDRMFIMGNAYNKMLEYLAWNLNNKKFTPVGKASLMIKHCHKHPMRKYDDKGILLLSICYYIEDDINGMKALQSQETLDVGVTDQIRLLFSVYNWNLHYISLIKLPDSQGRSLKKLSVNAVIRIILPRYAPDINVDADNLKKLLTRIYVDSSMQVESVQEPHIEPFGYGEKCMNLYLSLSADNVDLQWQDMRTPEDMALVIVNKLAKAECSIKKKFKNIGVGFQRIYFIIL